ncbi:hypothetical protein FACS1894199_07080 [Bacteroidia bacterium]|nr:hypothetical protein FACS1894199_07080 [Bacteroidia bacterium]
MKNLKSVFVLLGLAAVIACASDSDLIGNWQIAEQFASKGRTGAVTFSIGEVAYVGLGRDQDQYDRQDFWQFSGSSWKEVAPFPGKGRYGAVAFSDGVMGYVGLGYTENFTGIGGPTGNSEYLFDFWKFDPQGTTTDAVGDVFVGHWDSIGIVPAKFKGRRGAIGFSIGNKGYVGTGYNKTDGTLNDYWEFDIGTEQWSNQVYKGVAREGAVVWVIGGSAYIATGQTGSADYVSEVLRFTPGASTDPDAQWETLDYLKDDSRKDYDGGYAAIRRAYGVAFVVKNAEGKDRAYITLGTLNGPKTDCYEFSPEKREMGEWAQVTGVPGSTSRVQAISFVHNNQGYVVLGGSGIGAGVTQKMFRFQPGIANSDQDDD